MTYRQLPTQAQIKELLHYDPETGIFRWRYSPSSKVKPWDVAGTISDGYLRITILKKRIMAHRLAWAYITGVWPKNDIDHFDGVRSNNAWQNLREATRKENMENTPLIKANTSGFRGVSWDSWAKKWKASVQHNKKTIYVGRFNSVESAAQAVTAKRAELFTHDTGRDQLKQ